MQNYLLGHTQIFCWAQKILIVHREILTLIVDNIFKTVIYISKNSSFTVALQTLLGGIICLGSFYV